MNKVCDLVYLDLELTMNQANMLLHASTTFVICVRFIAGQAVTQQLVVALIAFRLDCCNSVLVAELPVSTLEPLQHVQNAPA